MAYDALLFDLDDTLLDFRACEYSAFKLAFCSIVSLPSEKDFDDMWATYQEVSAVFWAKREELGGRRSIQLAIDASLERCGIPIGFGTALSDAYWREFCCMSCAYPGVLDAIKVLATNFRLGVVTNGLADAQRGRLRASGLESYFKAIAISDEVGYAKPDERIFHAALDQLCVTPDRALFVGDSIEYDYAGALRAGVDFCLVRNDGGGRSDVQCKHVVTQLPELLPLLLQVS